MNFRSLRFQLIAWFAGLFLLVILVFGAYTYTRLQAFLLEVQRVALLHRTEQIEVLLRDGAQTGEEFVATEIEERFAPELNDKFVRVTRGDGSILFISEEPNDHSFYSNGVPALVSLTAGPSFRRESGYDGDLLIASRSVNTPKTNYVVEVGVALGGSVRVLHALTRTLVAGLPVVIALAILGGYLLVHRALKPVQSIMRAAQAITLSHLSLRLPVPESGDEIASLSLVLNQMIERLDDSFQNTSRFTADASHELRTPLTIIRGELEALLRGNLALESRNALASLLEEIERLVQIVEGLFALSRLDTGEAQVERIRLDLADLVETTAEQMWLMAEEKKITLIRGRREKVEVEGDRSRLKQMVVNLLDNAIKYTQSGGHITVEVFAQGAFVLFAVTDDGPGVPASALPHLFQRFYRADEVRSQAIGGAGLGLSIVHSICSAHVGTVTVTNVLPHGCCVTVSLPRAL